MKRIITCLGILLGASLLANAQTSETRNLDSFNEIRVSESITVRLKKGNANVAQIETRGVDADRVETEVEGSTLYIRMKRGNYFSKNVEIDLTYAQELEAVSVSSSASVISKDEIAVEDFDIRASSSGRADLLLNVRKLDVRISSSADVFLDGKAKYQDIDISSSGRLSAYGLDSEEVDISVSSSGKAEVTVHGLLEGKASSSGRVYYKGSPDKVYVDTSSSGKIRKEG
ncbi:Putative auto-transporter adhesin, head GIN domain [Reichenbachiella faecimaris]|uniref:Putative auto-transporter adhesin, head GIN domain n=1 Tax=Reichenbachiella faecimaris TaxID=692418 RepID=A0A1W2G613_REIFA|nr:head GIN domain-containing protein [Reichenbachiella faecimaris]SMD31974.1 Putative auto-transporter adhesin, head GIN domain [Reichenbachiella faecimaris]